MIWARLKEIRYVPLISDLKEKKGKLYNRRVHFTLHSEVLSSLKRKTGNILKNLKHPKACFIYLSPLSLSLSPLSISSSPPSCFTSFSSSFLGKIKQWKCFIESSEGCKHYLNSSTLKSLVHSSKEEAIM